MRLQDVSWLLARDFARQREVVDEVTAEESPEITESIQAETKALWIHGNSCMVSIQLPHQ